MVTAATLRVPETRAELNAVTVAGRGAKRGRPTVMGTAATLRVPETRAELNAVTVAGRGAKGRRPTVMGTAATLRVPETRAELVVAAASLRVAQLADEWERMESELDESDIRACGGFLPWAALA